MKGRIPANSESLKKHFPQVYKELFSKCPIVVSAPGSFWWTGAYSVLEGNLGILQKIPLRVYVGLEEAETKTVKIATFQHYNPYQKKFESSPLEEPASSKLIEFLKNLEAIQKNKGIVIHFLLEVPPGRGLNASSALSCALALATYLLFNKITTSNLKTITSESFTNVDKNRAFDQLFRMAWKLDHVFHGIASGAGVFSSMLFSSYPIVYFVEKIRLSPQSIKNALQSKFAFIDNLKYFGTRLNELIDLPQIPNWPIDFGLIFSGTTDATILTSQSTFERRENLWQMKKQLKKEIKVKPIKQLMDKNQYFKGDKYRLWRTYIDPMQINAFEAIYALKEIFEKGLSERALNLFFDFITRTNDLLQMLGFSNTTTEKICQEVKNALTTDNHTTAATAIAGGSQKGDILFASPYNSAHDKIDQIVAKLQEELTEDITLDYASWLDGLEDEGVRVEQHLDEKIYSDYISDGSIKFIHFSKTGFTHPAIYSLEEFHRRRKTMDFVIDTVENEVWVHNHRLDSKEIPSATATIKILKILLEKPGKEVPNSSLPSSSYSSDRNELQSKIISPLNRQLRKRLKKDLPLQIRGGINNFTVKLSQPPFDIHIIEKVF